MFTEALFVIATRTPPAQWAHRRWGTRRQGRGGTVRPVWKGRGGDTCCNTRETRNSVPSTRSQSQNPHTTGRSHFYKMSRKGTQRRQKADQWWPRKKRRESDCYIQRERCVGIQAFRSLHCLSCAIAPQTFLLDGQKSEHFIQWSLTRHCYIPRSHQLVTISP